MTKLTFDVDFTKDPEEILHEIQERAKAEVAKRESKIKSAVFLSNLHEKVNQEIGTDFKTVNDLIRALTAYANPKLRDKISSTSPSGRRVTISMSQELFEEIKSKLSQPNPNKAAIARETGASVVQVRKVANGGFDAKFAYTQGSKFVKPVHSKKTNKDLSNNLPSGLPKIPPTSTEKKSFRESPSALTSEPVFDQSELPIAPPSLGEEILEAPVPIASPTVPSFELPLPLNDSPSVDDKFFSKPTKSTMPPKPSSLVKSKSGKNVTSGLRDTSTLSLKSGKKKPGGLKITRPPMKPPSA